MSAFDEFLNLAKSQIVDLAKSTLKDYANAAIADGHKFLEDCKADLALWINQLARRTLSPDEFASMLQGQKELMEMEALKQAGLAEVRIDQFRNALLDTLVKAAIKFIP